MSNFKVNTNPKIIGKFWEKKIPTPGNKYRAREHWLQMFGWPIPIPVSPPGACYNHKCHELHWYPCANVFVSTCRAYLDCRFLQWLWRMGFLSPLGFLFWGDVLLTAPGQSRAGVPGSSVQHSYSLQVSQSSGRTVISPPPQSLLETQTANISLPRLISDCDPSASVHVSWCWWDDESDRKLLSVRSIRLPRDCPPR